MRASEKLSAAERVQILTGRVANLKAGRGDYDNSYTRGKAIREAESGLALARKDLAAESQRA